MARPDPRIWQPSDRDAAPRCARDPALRRAWHQYALRFSRSCWPARSAAAGSAASRRCGRRSEPGWPRRPGRLGRQHPAAGPEMPQRTTLSAKLNGAYRRVEADLDAARRDVDEPLAGSEETLKGVLPEDHGPDAEVPSDGAGAPPPRRTRDAPARRVRGRPLSCDHQHVSAPAPRR